LLVFRRNNERCKIAHFSKIWKRKEITQVFLSSLKKSWVMLATKLGTGSTPPPAMTKTAHWLAYRSAFVNTGIDPSRSSKIDDFHMSFES